MNHTIIKKALNEALAQKYYDELMKIEDEEHIFGVGFTADMKRLIRKTDDKLLYYSKYAAIAACACIAIGCAVLLPNLINSGIRTEPPVTTTPVVESDPESVTTTPEDTSLPIIITTTEGTTTVITTVPDETTLNTDSAVTSEVTTTETTTAPTETTTTPVTTTEEKITETKPDDDADAEDDIVDDDTDADIDSDTPDSDGDVIIDTEEGDDVVIEDDEDDTTVDIENDVETEEDDEVEIEDDCDVEEDDDVDVDEDVDVDDDSVGTEKPVTAETLGHGIAFFLWDNHLEDISGRIYANNGYHVMSFDDGETVIDYLLDYRVDLSFIADYLADQSNAPRITSDYPDINKGDYFAVTVSDIEIKPSDIYKFNDYSMRNEYDYYFNDNPVEDEMDDEDIIEGNEVRVVISRAGYVMVERYDYETVYFDTDDTATTELFGIIDSGKFNESSTVGDFTGQGVTADNMYNAYGYVKSYDLNVFNINFNTAAEREELMSFVNSLSGKKLIRSKDYVEYGGSYVVIGLKDRPAVITIMANKGKLYFSDDRSGWYYINITQAEYEEFTNLICKAGNVAQPYYYKNAYDYLTNAYDFNTVRSVNYSKIEGNTNFEYKIKDEKALADFCNFITEELKTAEYTPGISGGANYVIYVWLSSNCYMTISNDDIIKVLGNKFSASDGFYDRVVEYIKKYAEQNSEELVIEEDDVVINDDVDIAIEDEIDE